MTSHEDNAEPYKIGAAYSFSFADGLPMLFGAVVAATRPDFASGGELVVENKEVGKRYIVHRRNVVYAFELEKP